VVSPELMGAGRANQRRFPTSFLELYSWSFSTSVTFLLPGRLWGQHALTPVPVAGLRFAIPQQAVCKRLHFWVSGFSQIASALSVNLKIDLFASPSYRAMARGGF
jgi:hypothetical protein